MRRSEKANGKKAQNRLSCVLEQEKKIGDSQIASRPDTQNAHKQSQKGNRRRKTRSDHLNLEQYKHSSLVHLLCLVI